MNAVAQALAALDVGWFRRAWSTLFPAFPPPASDAETLQTIHFARTQAASLPLAKRIYSHAWLEDRGLPSGLPDELRPERPERRIALAVGVIVQPLRLAPADAKDLERVMAQAGGEAIEAGITDPREISRAMWAARERFYR